MYIELGWVKIDGICVCVILYIEFGTFLFVYLIVFDSWLNHI